MDDTTMLDTPPSADAAPSTPLPLAYMNGIKEFEGFAPRAKWDYKQNTNGFGTRAAYPGEVIDKTTAELRFNQEVAKAATVVNGIAPNAPEGVKAALTSLTFNSGTAWTAAGLGDAIRAGDYATAKEHFLQYNHAGGVVNPALTERRQKEAQWFDGVQPSGEPKINFGAQLTPHDLLPPPPPPSEAQTMKAQYAMSQAEKTMPWYEPVEAAAQETLTGRIVDYATSPNFAPDPSYQLTEDDLTEARKAGVSESYIPALGNAVSKDNFNYLVKQSLDDQHNRQVLADAGWTGTGLQIASWMLDPVAIAAGSLTGGLADAGAVALGAGTLGRLGAAAAGGAASNIAIDESLKALGDPEGGEHLFRSAAIGALAGLTYGAIAHNPLAHKEMTKLQEHVREWAYGHGSETTANNVLPQSEVGAAINRHVNMPLMNDPEWNALTGDAVPHGAMGKARFSTFAELSTHENPGVRLGSIMVQDAVGGSKDSKFAINPTAVETEQKRFMRKWNTNFDNTVRPAFDEWAKSKGYRWWQKPGKHDEFGEEVWDYVHGEAPPVGTEWSPAIKRVGDLIRKQNKSDVLPRAKNPWTDEGLSGPAVAGFEEVPENELYMSRLHSAKKWNDTIETYSMKGPEQWWEGAIKAGHAGSGVEIEDDLANAMARGIVKNSYLRANDIDERLNTILAGKDFDGLAAMLREEGVQEDRITNFLSRWKGREGQGQTDVRAKPRVLIDEKYKLNYPKVPQIGGMGTITLKDFVHSNAINVHQKYLRHMSGRIALSRMRLKNPNTGNYLVDGITSDADFEKFIGRLKKLQGDLHDPKSKFKPAEQTLRWAYDRILGRTDPAQMTNFATFSRYARKANFIRVFGQVAFSQMQDFSSGVAQLGLKAMLQHMPAMRRIINMKGEEILANDHDHVLESQVGISSDAMRGQLAFRDQEALLEGKLGKLDNALETGQHIVSKLSGMEFVNTFLTRMTAKAVVQKFADIARRPSKANMQRLADIGIDPKMLDRIVAEVKKNFDYEDGPIFGKKVTKLNLDKWEDKEARAAFENGIFRWTRKIVQENDYGSMARWMSHPMAQLFTQFRTFTFSAWENQTLHNLKMMDPQTFHMFWTSLALAAVTYAARTQLRALGRDDRDEYLKKSLSIDNIAKAAFQMAGWSSILPMVIDTAIAPFHDPLFDYRSTQQATNAITGNPTGDLLNTFVQAMRGTTDALTSGRELSQEELRKWQRLLPLGTWYPMVPLFNAMIAGRPKYTPHD
jgi:GH24 family phage-related lysozyme (muramidase)